MNDVKVLDPDISLVLATGKTLTGRLEHFVGSKSLVIFEEESLAPAQLTVLKAEAPDAYAALATDEVLLRNWTDMRGVAAALVDSSIVELTGQEVRVGTFRLHALVARVL